MFRISLTDLEAEGFKKVPSSTNLFLTTDPSACSVDDCSIKVPGSLAEQENEDENRSNGISHNQGDDSYYCARRQGDCGAHLPIYRMKPIKMNGTGESQWFEYGYSFDASSEPPANFTREEQPFCFGWGDESPQLAVAKDQPVEKQHVEKCRNIDSVVNAEIIYSDLSEKEVTPVDGHQLGATATLKCGPGYAAAGQSILMCTRNGWYPNEGIGYCVSQSKALHPSLIVASDAPQTCAAVTKPPNSNIVYSTLSQGDRYSEATTATVMCNLGFVLTSQATSTCHSGEWTPPLAFCTSLFTIHCSPLQQPANGYLSFSNSTAAFSHGSTVTITCNPNYGVRGDVSATCTNTGWSKPLGQCFPIAAGSCSPIANTNGMVSYTLPPTGNMYPTATTAFLMCNIGTAPTGSVSSICTNGIWQPQMGTCPITTGVGTCSDLAPPFNGYINYSPYSIAVHQPNTVATLTCNPGYTASGTLSSTCSNSAWNPPILGTCNQGSTGTANATVTNANDFPAGGSGVACANPIILNGQVTYSQGSSFEPTKQSGTTATVTCQVGYSISGSGTTTCSNGAWNPPLGTCNLGGTGGANCMAQIAPAGANLAYSQGGQFGPFPSGTQVTVQCTNGGTVQGSSSAACQNGVWSPATLGTCSSTGTGTGTGSCTAMAAPLGATMAYSSNGPFGPFPSGTTVTAQCPSGQSIQGVATATCLNGLWSPVTLGMCTQTGTGTGTTNGQCQAISAVQSGQVTYSNLQTVGPFPVGTVATLQCQNGAIASGSYVSSCMSQGGSAIWSPNMGTCTGGTGTGTGTGTGQCIFAPPIPLGATPSYSSGPSLGPWNSGTTVTISCPSGGSVQGSPTATCNNGQWTQLGTCSGGGIVTGLVSPDEFNSVSPLIPNQASTIQPIETNYVNGTFNLTDTGSSCTQTLSIAHSTLSYSPPFGQPSTTQPPFPTGTTATIGCESGWRLDGVISTSVLGTTGNGCAPLGALASQVSSGQAVYTPSIVQTVPFGTSAQLFCFPGYTASGTQSVSCTQAGWQPAQLGTCVPQGTGIGTGTGTTCLGIATPFNGQISYNQAQVGIGSYPSSSVATLICNSGTIVSGSLTSTCQNGIWTPTLGTCQTSGTGGTQTGQGACPVMPTPFNGHLTYNQILSQFGTYITGTIVSMNCNTGYTISGGQNYAICQNGVWQPSTLATCVQSGTGGIGTETGTTTGSCSAPLPLLNGQLTYSMPQTTLNAYSQGTVVTVLCNANFVVSGTASSSCISGQWSPPLTATCNPSSSSGVQSGSGSCAFGIQLIFNGNVLYSNGASAGPYPSGTVATIACNPNYLATGTTSSICTNSAWSPPALGTCNLLAASFKISNCKAIPKIPGATITYNATGDGSYEQHTVAKMTCDNGAVPDGLSKVTCESSGGWSPFPGLGSCPFNDDPYTPSISSTPSPNSIITSDDSIKLNKTEKKALWAPLPKMAMMKRQPADGCPLPVAPSYGEITFSYESTYNMFPEGTTAALRCRNGYSSLGATFSTCSKGSFRPILGKCMNSREPAMPGVCMPLAPPMNGRVRFSRMTQRRSVFLQITYIQSGRSLDFEEGTTALLYCDEG
ncbi:hypothetical protein WR25_11928 isoform C [Diploscapter pachys]|nr:hypothetical protein WR25_11928 isoform C [Diploscapter pachys]